MQPLEVPASPSPFVKRANVVALIGIDDAGKTTQAKRLVAWLEARGRACTLHPNEDLEPLKGALEHVAATSGYADAIAMLGLETLSLVLAVIKWNTLAKVGPALAEPGRFVVVDRYSYCQVAAARSGRLESAPVIDRLFSVFPDPDLTIFVDVSPAEAARRRAAHEVEDVPLPPTFLEGHAAAYRELPQARNFIFVNGERPADEVHEEILGHVTRRFPDL